MARVTSKLQVTVPRTIARQYAIEPGSEIEWLPAGDTIRVLPPGRVAETSPADLDRRLSLFDAATARQARRQAGRKPQAVKDRGWTRAELYDRGRSR
jgi:bifunctional DNA-binding transcriptional regulator/antitoxin component of YhaV-PrlF toxin-antitoxin module